LGGAGSALIGFPIGTVIGGGDANWTLTRIVAGLLDIGIPTSYSVNKNIKNLLICIISL
jgi:hypothetical protein